LINPRLVRNSRDSGQALQPARMKKPASNWRALCGCCLLETERDNASLWVKVRQSVTVSAKARDARTERGDENHGGESENAQA
jgi:hypothetical protein